MTAYRSRTVYTGGFACSFGFLTSTLCARSESLASFGGLRCVPGPHGFSVVRAVPEERPRRPSAGDDDV